MRKQARELEQKVQGRLVDEADVVCATCLSSAGFDLHQGSSGRGFTHVLMDEAAQASEVSALVPIAQGCEKLVLVGDQAQLGPQLASHVAAHLGLGESLFGRLVRQGARAHFLDTQFRMHPAISAYPSRAFYRGRLRDGVNGHDRPPPAGFGWPQTTAHGITPFVFLNVESSEQQVGTSRANRAEAAVVAGAARGLLPSLPPGELAIITPYAAQANELRTILRDDEGTGRKMTIATVDAFQGMEHEVIIVSTVRASSSAGAGFLSDARRLNVLLTRARRGLVLVGHGATLLRDPAWAPLLRYMWREGLVQGEGLEPFHRLDAADDVDAGSAAPTYNHPSGPWTWLAFAGRGGGRAHAPSAEPAAAPLPAYDWREDLKADSHADAELKPQSASAEDTAVKEEAPKEVAKEAAPPKRKKPKFL